MLTRGFGGAERLFVDCCRGLADAGHQVLAVCHPEFEALTLLECPQVHIAPLHVQWDWSPLARKRLARILREHTPQVIHSHLSRGSALAGDVGTRMGFRVIANVHNYINLKYYRNISHFCPSTEDQKHYLLKKGVSDRDISIIPHFSLIPVVNEEDIRIGHEPPILISFGRFVHKKGFHLLIDAVRLLVDSGEDIQLVLGGDGPEKEKLRRQVQVLKLENHVKFYGWVNDVRAFLHTGSYFVLPSLDEPFGIVILEAMASGKTILASKAQGPQEILDASTAWMFELNDSADLADALRKAISQPQDSVEKARAALARYRAKYAPEQIIPSYVSLYRKLAHSI